MTDKVTKEQYDAAVAAFGLLPNYNEQSRTALADALALSDLYPAPTPDETALIDAQVASALLSYTQLENPPADIVALASNLAVLKIEGRL
jgi:hypothetical protein